MNEEDKTVDTVESTRLGKEAKIGVVVILVLFLIFVGVVVMKFTGGGSGEELAAAESQHKQPEPGQSGDLFPESLDDHARPADPPRVLTPEAGSDIPPINDDSSQWTSASDRSVAPPPPPSTEEPKLISPPPMPPATQSSGRYGAAPTDAYSVPPAVSDAQTQQQPPAGDNLYPDNNTEQSGYSAAAAPPPLPPYREDNRYGNSGYNSPPEQSHPDNSYPPADHQTQAAPVSQYGGSRSQYDEPPYAQRSQSPPAYDDPPPRRDFDSFDAPPVLKDGKYEVQPLDNFWKISEKLYGTGAYFKALMEHNRDKMDDDGRLQPGALVLAPKVEELEKLYPGLCPKPSRRETLQNKTRNASSRRNYHSGRTYTVAEGDTLFEIARYELGKASLWVEIYDLNRDVLGNDFNYITPGTKLYLPESRRPDVLAEPPHEGYRR